MSCTDGVRASLSFFMQLYRQRARWKDRDSVKIITERKFYNGEEKRKLQ